jgi:hypothetical protein
MRRAGGCAARRLFLDAAIFLFTQFFLIHALYFTSREKGGAPALARERSNCVCCLCRL